MQRTVRINDSHLLYLSSKTRQEATVAGYLYKRSNYSGKWRLRWFALYQNLLFYFDSEHATKPAGLVVLEGCDCETKISSNSTRKDSDKDKANCFTIYFRYDGHRPYDLCAEKADQCAAWVEAIRHASFNKLTEQKEQLEQKHLHILQILESERQAKWQYVRQVEDLSVEVKKLRKELQELKHFQKSSVREPDLVDEDDTLRKVKKVQSFFRGWLCRRRWKQVVEQYIHSEHAENMRLRNQIVFGLVDCEVEYVEQLSILVKNFLQPLRMSASSKKPLATHEEVNSIFLNAETLLFLHRMFLQGLKSKMENWPTLHLGDLFDLLLPMLNMYQEYVRNHHYSLQVLAECKQRGGDFNETIKRCEEKAVCEGRTLEGFLTFPMHQIPRYIVTLHELLARTPHDHVDRKKLEFAKSKLELLSQIMHDEVSETENIRKNLAIERLIVEGCDILLDVNQTFIRQGTLIQVLNGDRKDAAARGRLGSFKETRKEVVRQVFLFTYHLLLTSRSSNGRLHLAKNCGKISLADCTLIEDACRDAVPAQRVSSEQAAVHNSLSVDSRHGHGKAADDRNELAFRLQVAVKNQAPIIVTLLSSSAQEKAGWCSDISQCIEQLRYGELAHASNSNASDMMTPSVPHSPVPLGDPKTMFRDDVDIKFSNHLNTSNVPLIRYASVDKLIERLIDLRFPSVDFLNTFLLTYRVFTGGKTIIQSFHRVLYDPDCGTFERSTCLNASQQAPLETLDGASTAPAADRPRSESNETQSSAEKQTADDACSTEDKPSRRISTGMMHAEPLGSPRVSESYASQSDGQLSDSLPAPAAKARFAVAKLRQSLELTNQNSDCCDGATLITRDSPVPSVFSSPCRDELASMTALSLHSTDGRSTSVHSPSSPSACSMSSPSGAHFLSVPTKLRLAPIASCETLDETQPQLQSPSQSQTQPRESQSPQSVAKHERRIPSTSSNPDSTGNANASGSDTDAIPASPVPLLNLPDVVTFDDVAMRSSPGPPRRQHSATPESSRKQIITVQGSCSQTSTPVHNTRLSIQSLFNARDSPQMTITKSDQREHERTHVDSTATQPRIAEGSTMAKNLGRFSPIAHSHSSPSVISSYAAWRNSRKAQQTNESDCATRLGSVVTSGRASKRRSSSAQATQAFAVATAGYISHPATDSNSSHVATHLNGDDDRPMPTGVDPAGQHAAPECASSKPRDVNLAVSSTSLLQTETTDSSVHNRRATTSLSNVQRERLRSAAVTTRILNVLKHWVTKQPEDFVEVGELCESTRELLEKLCCDESLLPAEHKIAVSILRMLNSCDASCMANSMRCDVEAAGNSKQHRKMSIEQLLTAPSTPVPEFDNLAALELAEQMTYLDYNIFRSITSRELLNQSWMKEDKLRRAPHVTLAIRRFNEVSSLVVSEIIRRGEASERAACIEKWAAIADICRCMHNYNGVLQVCAAFTNSAVYRLKQSWERVSKQSKQMVDRLQHLVSSDGRFKRMREALRRCDPPCIPYLGMYLSDLTFIEEGTSTFTEDGLVNFCKMRMIAHTVREIQFFQQTPYRIDYNPRVCSFLLDTSRVLSDDDTYKASLQLEPKLSQSSTSLAINQAGFRSRESSMSVSPGVTITLPPGATADTGSVTNRNNENSNSSTRQSLQAAPVSPIRRTF